MTHAPSTITDTDLREKARLEMVELFRLGREERVVVLTDTFDRGEDRSRIAETLHAAACETAVCDLLRFEPLAQSGIDPPGHVVAAMQEADVILVATRRSITHSAATVRARRGGARVGTHTPFVESYARCVGDADEIHAVGERLARALNDRARGGLLHVTTREGTYLRVPLGDRPFFNWAARIHDAGTVENVPGGEVINAPPEGRAEGRIHVNLKLPSWASATLPYDMEVREGRLVACPQDPLLIERYKARPDRDLLCEIAFGTSHLADRHGPCIMEVEKTLGTGHVAFGSNVSFGGANQSDVHMDFIFDRVTASLDGRTIIEDGKMCV